MVENIDRWTLVQVVAIGIFLVGGVIAGYGAYTGYQSTPYMVHVDEVSLTPNGSAILYDDLSASQKEIFDRITTDPEGPVDGQAAPVSGTDLSIYANNDVVYQGEYYTFELTYDPGTLTPLVVGIGGAVAGLGLVFLLLARFASRRKKG